MGCIRFGLAFKASQPVSHYIKCAKLADKYGFDMFQVYDDLLFKPSWPILFAVASYANNRRSNFTLGPGIANPYHMHPALIVTNTAFLDEESGGRAFLMFGRGAFYELFDIKTQRPITAVKEAIEIMDNLLSGRQVNLQRIFFQRKRRCCNSVEKGN
jgi:5,10-methylenetetrahydromethanopterin reductase